MKVLHVIPSLSRVHGGPTRALGLMERALALQGVEVETATTDDDGPGRHNGKACGLPIAENGAVRWYFSKRLDFYKTSPSFAAWAMREIGRFDLVHIHALFSFTTPAAAWAAHRAALPYVVRPLGTLNDYGMTRRRPWLKKLSMRLVEGPVLRHAAAVHFTSEAEAAEARRTGIRMREAVIPLAVEATVAGCKAEGTRDGHCILFLSRLDPKKNLEGLLEAVAILQHELPQIRLVIAGDGAPAYVAALKSRSETLTIAARVSWTGHVEGEAKERLLATSGVFVLPSFSENFGIAAAEALAAGLPCVLGAGVAIASDVARVGAGITTGADAESIARALRDVLGSASERAAMAEQARRLANERYSMEAMGGRLKQLYCEILRSRETER